ncbi:MAG TPA: alkaline phosphatase family protein [Candidatus Polarisedimenticolia bacterium]|nr:alkaline phosphatase family protein [Candidatus Polarisedimenticolia bacterium]
MKRFVLTSRLMRAGMAMVFLAPAVSMAAETKVVIIGFDGADARLTEQYIEEGKLPNLKSLRESGSYARLMPTNPPQTPVSWSAFATGKNPGKTGIFDFLKRSPGNDYLPTLAFTTETKRPFLWGRRNATGLGLAAGAGVALLAFGFCLLFRAKRLVALVCGLATGALAGGAGYFVGANTLPESVPWAVNNRQGATLWDLVAANGDATQVIRVPQNFPAPVVPGGRVLSGLGVPDMRGRVGTPSYYTSEPGFKVADNEFAVEVIPLASRTGAVTSSIYGPLNQPFYQYRIERALEGVSGGAERRRVEAETKRLLDEEGVKRRIDLPVTFTVSDDGSAVTIEVQKNHQTLKVGEWSDWNVLTFPINWLVDSAKPLRGIARWKVLSTRPDLKLYLSPLNFHPESQPVPFSYPVAFAGQLQEKLGFFKTLGWVEDTWTLPTGLVPDEFFLEDMGNAVDSFEAMMEAQLAASRDRLYVQVFDFTDRIGHMFWRYLDDRHPFHDPGHDPAHVAKMREEMVKAYQRMDAIVGKARQLAGPDALLIVLSDHGFGSFRRGINFNSWLVAQGFMTIVGDAGETKTLEDLFETRQLFEKVDWSRTQAYAMGLGGIYINLAGRETKGSVQPGEEYEQVCKKIIAGLEAAVDPVTGERPVSKVFRREEMYTGFDPTLIPDLRVGNNLGYRIGWQTALGQVPKQIYEDNLKAWSGDHCSVDPAQVQGILFVNRKLSRTDVNIVDVMPTVLKAMDISVPADVDGKPFL